MSDWDTAEVTSGQHPFKWSLLTATDKATIKRTVEAMCDSLAGDTLNFLEIGTYNASTAWGVKALTEGKGKKLNYHGIDVMTHGAVLFPEATMIYGDSTKIFYVVPELPFDLLFIDGPHSSDHCMLDFLNFAPKVKIGGLILFHDASPASQFPVDCKLPPEKEAEWNRRSWAIPAYHEFGTAVTVALKKLGLSTGARTDYELVSNNWTDEPYGGISIFKRLR